jgi:hypothetical protein
MPCPGIKSEQVANLFHGTAVGGGKDVVVFE